MCHGQEPSEKLLGVHLQPDLKWYTHVRALANGSKLKFFGLEKLKFIMNKAEKDKIVKGVFNCSLVYSLPVFGGCIRAEVNILQVLQNRASQIVLNTSPRTIY